MISAPGATISHLSNPGQAQANIITPVPTNQLTLHQLAKWGNTDQATRLREWHDEGCLNIYRDRPRQPQFDLSPGMGQTTPPKYWTNLTEEQRVDISITLLAEAAELGPACLAGKIDRYFARCDSACSTSDTEIARLRALRRRRGRPAPINDAHRRRRAWEMGYRPSPTELERGTCDDPIVLDPPGKFQCIVEAAIF